MDIKGYLSNRKEIIDKAILSFVPRGEKYTRTLHDAVKYSLMSGGRRIRPILVLAACEAVSGGFKNAIPAAAAIEMIHTYTLIHDDLPAMDDDDLRRGKPTCHRVFGEDVAILAGDLLNTLAFQIIAENYKDKAGVIISELSRSLGINGIVGGQIADLWSKGKKIGRDELEFISVHKTAFLFIASVRMGAMVGGASGAVMKKLTGYATNLGLAFQIIDDIFDHTGREISSYPAVLGLDKSRLIAKKMLDLAIKSLPGKKNYRVLGDIALFLANSMPERGSQRKGKA